MAAAKRVLLLGSSGKMGTALRTALEQNYEVICRNSRDFDACRFDQVESVIDDAGADIVMNTVALLGIDACEKTPEKAGRLNALYPRYLADLSKERGFVLVHFSTDAVFDGEKRDYYVESDCPIPLNVYGKTKYAGDRFVEESADKYYLFRISVLFGPAVQSRQFVEKMIARMERGDTALRIADDIVLTPTYSTDVAREVRKIIEGSFPYGLYHVCNEGKASLYELTRSIAEVLHPDVRVERASHREFPSAGLKNTFTPLKSEKIRPLRPWREAVEEYCSALIQGKTDE